MKSLVKKEGKKKVSENKKKTAQCCAKISNKVAGCHD